MWKCRDLQGKMFQILQMLPCFILASVCGFRNIVLFSVCKALCRKMIVEGMQMLVHAPPLLL